MESAAAAVTETLAQAVQQFAEAYNHTLRQEGCSVEISAREAKAIAAIRPFLEERKGDVLTYTDTPEQASKLEEFAADLANDSDVTDEDRKICDAAWYVRPVWLFTEHPKHSLRRYLRARDWDMRKSYKLLSKSIEWRREATSKYKQCHFCAESVKAHAVKVVGFSKDLCPVIYTDFKHAQGRDLVRGPPHLFVVLLKAEELMKALGPSLCSDKVVLMVHFEGFSFSDMDPRTASAVLGTLGDHFPERLRKAVFIDAPSIFQPLWKVISKLLPPETAAKVEFVSTSHGKLDKLSHDMLDEPTAELLLEQVRRDKLPLPSDWWA